MLRILIAAFILFITCELALYFYKKRGAKHSEETTNTSI